jgi:hypothetical protein
VDNPSRRLVEQRLCNRVIDAVEVLADGDDGVRAVAIAAITNTSSTSSTTMHRRPGVN